MKLFQLFYFTDFGQQNRIKNYNENFDIDKFAYKIIKIHEKNISNLINKYKINNKILYIFLILNYNIILIVNGLKIKKNLIINKFNILLDFLNEFHFFKMDL